MNISIVIPCYNEKDTIRKIVKRVKKSPVNLHEIIIVDDDSRDGTRDILAEWNDDPVVKVFYHDYNRGKVLPCGPVSRMSPGMSSSSRMPTSSMILLNIRYCLNRLSRAWRMLSLDQGSWAAARTGSSISGTWSAIRC